MPVVSFLRLDDRQGAREQQGGPRIRWAQRQARQDAVPLLSIQYTTGPHRDGGRNIYETETTQHPSKEAKRGNKGDKASGKRTQNPRRDKKGGEGDKAAGRQPANETKMDHCGTIIFADFLVENLCGCSMNSAPGGRTQAS